MLTLKVSALSSDGGGIACTDRGIIFVQKASLGRIALKRNYYGRCGGYQLQQKSCIELGLMSAEKFEEVFHPEYMV